MVIGRRRALAVTGLVLTIQLLLLRVRRIGIGLLVLASTSLHGRVPVFTSVALALVVLLRRRGRGTVTLEALLVLLMLVSTGGRVVLVVRWNVDCFVLLHIGRRGDNVECVNDRWDLWAGLSAKSLGA